MGHETAEAASWHQDERRTVGAVSAESRPPGRPRSDRHPAARALFHADGELSQAREELRQGLLLLRDGPVADAYNSLTLAAATLASTDPAQARAACVHATAAAWSGGDRDGYLAALAALPAVPGPHDGTGAARDRDSPVDAFWRTYRDGMHSVMNGDFARADALLRPVLNVLAARREPLDLLNAGTVALMLGDLPTARHLLGLALAGARSGKAPDLVPRILEHLAYAELREGSHHQARVHAEAGLEAAGRLRQRNVSANLSAVLALAASITGSPATVAAHAQAALRVAHAHGLRQTATLAEWAQARADLGHGHAERAAARLAPVVHAGPRRGHFGLWVLTVPCYVEAAVLAGRGADVDADTDTDHVIDAYAVWAGMGADPQAPALLARCRALVAGDERAEELFADALARHDQVNGPFEHARTHLAYGMWLRRRRRPGEARPQLRSAVMGFEQCGADVWAEHARAELRAAGETTGAAGPEPGPLGRLTPQQLRIARHVAQGATNREVARQLSISTRTVEYHLRNVFTQLGVRSRVDLARLLGE
ncbi:LuxR C-terminal-related transcriptional regulator [Streptomyces sp. NPDC020996]|uniref:LuxR C-terminal-related transcriptional regulator n=1 Tax=Streptomyces sp. NPDC020996 TaxID=3154791 RepID=UPI0033DFEE29